MELKILSRCPTCHNQTLFLSDHGALVCSWIECKEPCVDRAIEALQARLAACEAECQEQCDGKIAFFNGMNDMREQREELQRKLAQAEARVQALEQEQATLKAYVAQVEHWKAEAMWAASFIVSLFKAAWEADQSSTYQRAQAILKEAEI